MDRSRVLNIDTNLGQLKQAQAADSQDFILDRLPFAPGACFNSYVSDKFSRLDLMSKGRVLFSGHAHGYGEVSRFHASDVGFHAISRRC